MNLHDLQRLRRRPIRDDIEPPESEPSIPEESLFLSEKKLRFVAAWTGNLIAAARAAGYKDPKGAAYKLMKDPKVVQALQTKQESMLQESGEHLARTLPLSRADVIDRLWELAQLAPERTGCNITGQVKAAQALEQIFALNIDRNEVLKNQLQGKSEAEIQFYVVHGFLPYAQEQAPSQLAAAETPQLSFEAPGGLAEACHAEVIAEGSTGMAEGGSARLGVASAACDAEASKAG